MADTPTADGHNDEGENWLRVILEKLATNDEIFEHRSQALLLQQSQTAAMVDRLATNVNALTTRIDKLVGAIDRLIRAIPSEQLSK